MLALLFDHFGPYHRARLQGAMRLMPCTGVEFFKSSQDYGWDSVSTEGLPILTVGDETLRGKSQIPKFAEKLKESLTSLRPSVVAVPGWSSKPALVALRWCLENQIPAIVMSESAKGDFMRRSISEWIKKRLIRLFSAGLVGGSRHVSYLHELGMSSEDIHLGYDAVDNDYFEKHSLQNRDNLPSVFLASARFIEKKNLICLLQAYAEYRAQVTPNSRPWDFVLLGDGPLRSDIEAEISRLGLPDCVSLPGFKQYQEIPRYYAEAGAFIHASTTEQWGLVVNEALASGLPALVSHACGCAPELLKEGVNGYTFDPLNVHEICRAMLRVSGLPREQRSQMGAASREIISHWGPARFGSGLLAAAQRAIGKKPCPLSWFDDLLLTLMTRL